MQKIKILIVEDESLVALYLQKSLQQEGYEVGMLATRGEEAVESAQRENPDVILMDIRLEGDVDGIEAARRISEFSPAKIIFNTSYKDPETKERAMALNPAAFLIKPVKIPDIQSVIRQIKQTRHS